MPFESRMDLNWCYTWSETDGVISKSVFWRKETITSWLRISSLCGQYGLLTIDRCFSRTKKIADANVRGSLVSWGWVVWIQRLVGANENYGCTNYGMHTSQRSDRIYLKWIGGALLSVNWERQRWEGYAKDHGILFCHSRDHDSQRCTLI